MLQDFKEKEGYKPAFKLEYSDDSGRNLNQKEAFRQLSHRFHGKGSGKKKTEKRSKKMEEDNVSVFSTSELSLQYRQVPSPVRPSSFTVFKHLLLQNRWAN